MKIRERIMKHLRENEVMYSDPEDKSIMSVMPISTFKKFGRKELDVDAFRTADDLPKLPERLMDFAFVYATQYLTLKQLAVRYATHESSVARWLAKPEVRSTINAIRQERRLWLTANATILEKDMYRTLRKIMNLKPNGDNIEAIRKCTQFVFGVVTGNMPQNNTNIIGNMSVNTQQPFEHRGREMKMVEGQSSLASEHAPKEITMEHVTALEGNIAKMKEELEALDA